MLSLMDPARSKHHLVSKVMIHEIEGGINRGTSLCVICYGFDYPEIPLQLFLVPQTLRNMFSVEKNISYAFQATGKGNSPRSILFLVEEQKK